MKALTFLLLLLVSVPGFAQTRQVLDTVYTLQLKNDDELQGFNMRTDNGNVYIDVAGSNTIWVNADSVATVNTHTIKYKKKNHLNAYQAYQRNVFLSAMFDVFIQVAFTALDIALNSGGSHHGDAGGHSGGSVHAPRK